MPAALLVLGPMTSVAGACRGASTARLLLRLGPGQRARRAARRRGGCAQGARANGGAVQLR
jgi:hypothetical protein